MKTKKLLKKWKKQWPSAIVPKKEIAQFTGGLIQPQTLTNLVAQGKAPRPDFYIRGQGVYEIDSILAWLKGHISDSYNGHTPKRGTPSRPNA